jgi:hypothetical protein
MKLASLLGNMRGLLSSSLAQKDLRGAFWTLMENRLAHCTEHLRKAVRHLAHSSDAPQEKLKNMYEDTRFGGICEDDFPGGSLRDDFLTIRGSLVKTCEPQVVVNIAAMSDEQALEVMQKICSLSQAAAYALGRQSNAG